MNKTKGKSKKLYYIFLPFVVILLALGITVDCLYAQYQSVINGALGNGAKASAEYIEAALENSKDVNIRLEEEGAVLLKNDGVLPIETDGSTPVNVYGILSAHHYLGGTGSGSNNAAGVDFKTALEYAGFSVNQTLWSLISSSKLGYESGSTVGLSFAGQYELDISKYESAVSFAAAKDYSEYAIVTFGVNGGEDSDANRGEQNSLELGANELALLERLDAEGFKVIVLLNTAYVMELGPVIQHADAILWIGCTGLYGSYGVANLLAGNANPSGRLVDTWMYEQETSSTFYTSDNANSYYVDKDGNKLGSYTNYNEGVYVGYRWYETADAEGYWDGVENEFGTGYEGVVAYPFGYGLSYTQFTERITSAEYKDGTFTFTVYAENKGGLAGKDVVELYVEKPYENGGTEVPKVELVAFAKTEELSPDCGQPVTLEFEDEYLASYVTAADGGNGCYVLAGGEYKFYLASATDGAHCWSVIDQDDVDRLRSFTLEKIEYSGDNKRASDSVTATNLLQVTDNDTGIASNDQTAGFNELSRKDGFANAALTISKQANPNGEVLLDENDPLYVVLKKTYGSNTYNNYYADNLAYVAEFTDPTVGSEKVYTLADLYTTDKDGNPLYTIDEETGVKTVSGEVDYDDPRWDALISQMTIAELTELIGHGAYGTIAIDSVEKLASADYDGPTGYSNFLKASLGLEQETTGFCSEPIMAATWNVDLVELFGEAVGMEGNAFGNNGWYAPGMNMHRTPYGGRTGDYFSEDPLITGYMGAAVAYGAFQKGVYTYAKHFAFNDIETNRSNAMNCWMSEQTAREVYLRPFEIAIKQGKMTGLMTSFMYMNGQWNGSDFNLITGIVRTEWNFKGVVTTDTANPSYMGAMRLLCGGADFLLSPSYSATNKNLAWVRCDDAAATDTGVCAMKTAAKHILFSYASAALHREAEVREADNSNVQALYISVNIIAYLGAAILAGLFAWRLIIDIKRSKICVVSAEENSDCDARAEKDDKE